MEDKILSPPVPTTRVPREQRARNVRIGQIDNNFCQFDDIIAQNIKKHFITGMIPIQLYPGLKIPESYTNYQKVVNATLHPVDLISTGTGYMLTTAIRDMVAGGHFSIQLNDRKNSNYTDEHWKVLQSKTKSLINKAILNAELYGNSAIVKGSRKVDIVRPFEFWYDEWNNIFYSVTPTVYNAKDGYMFEKRQMVDSKVQVVKFFSEGAPISEPYSYHKTITFNPFVVDKDKYDTPEALGVSLFTHNPENENWIGISALDNVLGQLQAFDLSVHEYTKAMFFTKPRAILFNDAVDKDPNTGEPIMDLSQDVYVTVDAIAFDDPKQAIQTVQFKFDAEAFHRKINDDLGIILSKMGLDNRILSFSSQGTVEKTATQVVYEDSRVNALIENRREEYAEQIYRTVELLESVIDTDVDIRFVPLHYLNMTAMVNVVQQMSAMDAISQEQKLRLIYPKWTDEEINQEIKKINGDYAREQMVQGEEYYERRKQKEQSGTNRGNEDEERSSGDTYSRRNR